MIHTIRITENIIGLLKHFQKVIMFLKMKTFDVLPVAKYIFKRNVC